MRHINRIVIALAVSVLAVGVFVVVIVPLLLTGEQITLFQLSNQKPKPSSQILPNIEGDHLLTGEVRKASHALPNTRFVFLFQDGYRTKEISTDALGRFEYRLPPGQWRFLGPLMQGNEAEEVYCLFDPEITIATPTFNVGTGPNIKTINVRISFGHK